MNRHRIIAIVFLIAFLLALTGAVVGILRQNEALIWPSSVVLLLVGFYAWRIKLERDRAYREQEQELERQQKEEDKPAAK